MSFKSSATKEAEERIKKNNEAFKQANGKLPKQSKETEMKNLTTKLKTPLTVFVTLAVVAAFAAVFYLGTQYQQEQHEQIVKAQAEAKADVVAQLKDSK